MANAIPLPAAARLIAGWLTVLIFLTVGSSWTSDLGGAAVPTALFIWLLGVILWCASGVIHEADSLAELLGEPLGTLILTFSIVGIEVMLISSVMLSGEAPTIGRDTMFAVMMIVLNGMVGLSLVVGGLRHHEQSYSLPGASAYLSVIVPLSVIALVLPGFTTSTSDGTLSTFQAIAFSVAVVALYVVFLLIQTGRHRALFTEEGDPADAGGVPHLHSPDQPLEESADRRTILRHTLLLLACAGPIVILSKPLGKVLDHGIAELDAPKALSGILIALIVFTPEGISALKAAYANQLQRTVNLCLGAFLSTVGLTLPAILTIGLITGQPVVLGVDPTSQVLIAVTLVLSLITFSGPRTTVLEGATHLMVFFVFAVVVFSP